MALRNSATQWGLGAKLFHWTMAIGIIVSSLFILHVNGSMPWFASGPMIFITYIHWHKAVGLILLALVVGRILWRRANPVPRTAPLTPFEATASHRVHILLYALMIAVPVSGWIASSAFGSPTKFWGMFTIPPIIPKNKPLVGIGYWVHFGLSWILLTTVIGHLIAAFWHHSRKHDATLKAMWFGRGR